jgi:hypothetical protein
MLIQLNGRDGPGRILDSVRLFLRDEIHVLAEEVPEIGRAHV